jgi:hypothetical protein
MMNKKNQPAMKRGILLTIAVLLATVLQAQVSKTLNVTAGGLSAALTANEKNTVTNLTLTGTIDARDFKTMRDDMKVLANIDLKGIIIVAYSGIDGTCSFFNAYMANTVPDFAFYSVETLIAKASLKSLLLPESVKTIGYSAFNYCTGLTDVYTLLSSVNIIGDNAFLGCSSITSINIPPSVTSIGNGAFSQCKSVTSIFVPATVTLIKMGVFDGCKCPINVDAGNPNYSSLDGVLFDKLTTKLIECPVSKTGVYTIPSTVTSIEDNSFISCINLTSVIFPSQLTSIGAFAFTACSNLAGTITFPSSLKTIKTLAFQGCKGIDSLVIPASVDFFGSSAFYNCTGLKSIEVDHVTPPDLRNSSDIFYGVDKNTCVLLVPYGTKSKYETSLKWNEFKIIKEKQSGLTFGADQINLEDANGSTAVVSITTNVSWSVSVDQPWLNVTPVSGDGNAELNITATETNTYLSPRSAIITISTKDYGSKAISVIQNASSNLIEVTKGNLLSILDSKIRKNIRSLKLKGEIDARDFVTMRDSMSQLEELDLSQVKIRAYSGDRGTSEYVTFYPTNEVPESAFRSKEWEGKYLFLTTIILPNTVTAIGRDAFYSCKTLRSITFPSSLTSIYSGAFWGCKGLTTINLPVNLKIIGQSSFSFCDTLSSFNIPASVETIGESAFNASSGNITVDEGNQNYSAAEGVLYNKDKTVLIHCPIIKTGNFSIPSSVNVLEKYAFFDCKNLTSIRIPSSVEIIRDYCFQSCFGLKGGLAIPSSVKEIGESAFSNCYGLTGTLNLSSSLKAIANGAFSGCQGLSGTITIPSSVTAIGSNAFSSCFNLSSLVVPASVKSIDIHAFSACIGLKSFYSLSKEPIDLSNSTAAFEYVDKTSCILYVPAGSKGAYQKADQWKDFLNIVEIGGLFVSNNNLVIPSDGIGMATTDIYYGSSWMATTDQNWLTISPSSGTGNSIITITAQPNISNIDRSARIMIAAEDADSKTITVIQLPLSSTKVSNIHNDEIKLYPNPVNEGFRITGLEGMAELTISDMRGKKVVKKTHYDNEYISVDFLTKGIYIVKITTEKLKLEKKLVKE